MTAAAVFGLSSGARLLGSSLASDQPQVSYGKHVIIASISSNYGSGVHSPKPRQAIKAIKEHVDGMSTFSTVEPANILLPDDTDDTDDEAWDSGPSVDALLLLQKSMLEKQWNLSLDDISTTDVLTESDEEKKQITSSGVSARIRRTNSRRVSGESSSPISIDWKLLRMRKKGKGKRPRELLTHDEVVQLSLKVQAGLVVEKRKKRLTEKLGHEPTEEQLAKSLRMSRAELRVRVMERRLASDKLTMSNTGLVMSIAKKYDNMGVEIADLMQGGLLGLARGVEKFDPSRGCRLSTYVYWWIRQGIRKTLSDHSKANGLPRHLYERLSKIRRATLELQEEGIEPTIEKLAETLNMSQKKILNATKAVKRVISLDSVAFPSLGDESGDTWQSFIADPNPENDPEKCVEQKVLKEEVKQLIDNTLGERDRRIIRLYYGFNGDSLSWEDISREVGLSRERVRQLGLVAMEHLKIAARKKELEAFVIKY